MDINKKNYENILTNEEIERYKRHITLEELGIQGQVKLKNSSVIFIGAGGLGSSAILYIAAAGIGKIGIIDNDQVEESNLQRQIIHTTSEIGQNKTDSAEKKIKLLNPNCLVSIFTERLTSKNILKIINEFDIVCDCSDNFGTKYLLNDACVILKKPFIYGSVQGFTGQISVFNLETNSPNLRDLIPKSPQREDIPSCSEFGVIGVSPGLIGILQANEIIKIIIKKGQMLDGKVLVFNLLDNCIKTLNLKANPENKNILDFAKYIEDYEDETVENINKIKTISYLKFKEIYKKNTNKILLIDVREESEYNKSSIDGSLSLPLTKIKNNINLDFLKQNYFGKQIYIICQKGVRSEKAVRLFMKRKINAISIEGGLDKLKELVK